MTDRELSTASLAVPNEGDALDLTFLLKVIQTRRWFIFTVTAVALTFALIYSLRLPTVYTAHTKILVEKVDPSAFQNPEMLKPQAEWGAVYYQTRAELLQNRHILEQAVDQTALVEHYRKIYRDHRLTKEQAVGILARKTEAKILRGTQIIELSVTDHSPEMSSKIANAIAENFLKESWRERLFISDQVLKWFPEEGETLQESSAINQLRKLQNQDAIRSLPSVLHDPVINSIKQDRLKVDTEIRELSRRYTLEHPRMKELLARADYLESEMNAQIEKIIAGLKSGLAGEFGVSNVKIAESAALPEKPSGPKRLRIIFLGALLGFLGSVIFSALCYHLDQNIRSEEDVKKIPLTFLGYVPLIPELNGSLKNNKSKSLSNLLVHDLRLIDEVTVVRAAILFSMPAERSKLIMCTSAIPEEGKTTLASMLGVSLAEAGEKVLLIDADMRKPSLHLAFGMDNEKGLSNCLVGAIHSREAVRVVEGIPGLHLMTAGEKTPNPTTLLGSQAFDHLIHELEPEYNRIIFDVPPALHMADGLILASKVHGTVLVFNAGKVHRSAGRKIKERINSANGWIIGAVINRADYKKLEYPYHRYYRAYGRYYHLNHAGPLKVSSKA